MKTTILKKLWLIPVFSLFSTLPAWALHRTECSNATATVLRQEQEIWGANPVDFIVNGKKNNFHELNVVETEKNILEVQGDENSLRGKTEFYTVKVKLSRKDGREIGPSPNGREIALVEVTERMICRSWANSARD